MTTQLTTVQQVCKTLTSPEMREKIAQALPPGLSPERFTRVALTAIQQSPSLAEGDRNSLYNACIKAAQDGLIPDGREGALVIYKTKDGSGGWISKVQWMPMVQGLLKNVRKSGELANVSVQVVKENDVFEYELGDNERLMHKPALSNRGRTIGAYSIVTLANGEKSREWMSVEQIEAIRMRSKSKESGPWQTDYDEMCRKTVFRRHYKMLPKYDVVDDMLSRDDDDNGLDMDGSHAQPASAANGTNGANGKRRPRAFQQVIDSTATVVDADGVIQEGQPDQQQADDSIPEQRG